MEQQSGGAFPLLVVALPIPIPSPSLLSLSFSLGWAWPWAKKEFLLRWKRGRASVADDEILIVYVSACGSWMDAVE